MSDRNAVMAYVMPKVESFLSWLEGLSQEEIQRAIASIDPWKRRYMASIRLGGVQESFSLRSSLLHTHRLSLDDLGPAYGVCLRMEAVRLSFASFVDGYHECHDPDFETDLESTLSPEASDLGWNQVTSRSPRDSLIDSWESIANVSFPFALLSRGEVECFLRSVKGLRSSKEGKEPTIEQLARSPLNYVADMIGKGRITAREGDLNPIQSPAPPFIDYSREDGLYHYTDPFLRFLRVKNGVRALSGYHSHGGCPAIGSGLVSRLFEQFPRFLELAPREDGGHLESTYS